MSRVTCRANGTEPECHYTPRRRLALIADYASRICLAYRFAVSSTTGWSTCADCVVLTRDTSARSIGPFCRSIGVGGRVDLKARVNGKRYTYGVECILSRASTHEETRERTSAPHYVQCVTRVLRSGTAWTIDIALTLIRRARSKRIHTLTYTRGGRRRRRREMD